jgi:hypothetical protein
MENGSYITTYEDYSRHVVRYREAARECAARLDECLEQKTKEAVLQFIGIVNDEEVRVNYVKASQKIMYAVIFAIIAGNEQKHGCEGSFLFNADSLDSLIRIFKQLEFCLWELEFDGSDQAGQRFFDMLRRHYISMDALYCAVTLASKNEAAVMERIANICETYGKSE